MQQQRVLIIGGGLSGVYLAYLLRQQNYAPLVLEAAPRLGGRIQTVQGPGGTPLELGATWFSAQHPHLLALLGELGLPKYPQYAAGISLFQTKSFEPAQQFVVPESDTPSYRLAGGTQRLIDALAEQFVVPESDTPSYRLAGGTQRLIDALAVKLPAGSVLLNQRVVAIEETPAGVTVRTAANDHYQGAAAVVCLPPQLAAATIGFAPALPAQAEQVFATVQTWMASSLKFALEYPAAFWRAQGYSGMVYSHAGIITEMYDHTNYEENRFGFTGFLVGGAAAYAPSIRQELVLEQFATLLGDAARAPTAYIDKVWTDAFVLAGNPGFKRPHQHNGHPLLHQPYLNGKLFFGGTETATAHSGYMEGAITAAKRLAATFA
jgi:monoamine oxidase